MERKLIAAAVSSALALPMAAQAVEFSASGHVNRAIISVDGGGMDYDGDLQHVDANSSQTRFRFTGSEEMDSGMTAGVQLEYGLTANVRQANVYLSSDGGKLTVGHGSRATDGMAHADLGGPAWLGGATNWCSYHSTGPACPSNDGGRGPMLRYDTPAIGPASIAVSTGNDDYWDVMLKSAGSFGDAGYDVRVGYIAEHDADVAEVPLSVTAVRAGDLRAALGTAEESVAEHFMAPDFSLQDADGKAIDDNGLTDRLRPRPTLVYKHQAKKASDDQARRRRHHRLRRVQLRSGDERGGGLEPGQHRRQRVPVHQAGPQLW